MTLAIQQTQFVVYKLVEKLLHYPTKIVETRLGTVKHLNYPSVAGGVNFSKSERVMKCE